MSAVELIGRLRELDVQLWLEGGKLRFDAPAGVMTPDLRSELVREKPELMAFLRSLDAGRGAPVPSFEPVPRQGPLPLSFSQRRLWLLAQMEPESPLYNIPSALRIRGDLNLRALRAALGRIVHRHEVLRTRIVAVDGEPRQEVVVGAIVEVPEVDLKALPPARREGVARRLALGWARSPFDLREAPLLRAAVVRLGGDERLFVFVVHHMAFDGWSRGILVRELLAFYRGFAGLGPAPELPALEVRYIDYAHWQQRWFAGGRLDHQLDFWKRTLAAAPPTVELPADRPRPQRPSLRGAHLSVRLPRPLTDRVEALGRGRSATLFVTLLAAFDALLFRLSGQRDLVLGTDVAGRSHTELEGLIGFFVNQVVLRCRVDGDLTFLELLDRVAEGARQALDHQELPFEKLVEELAPARELHRNPIFQVVFAFQNAPTLTAVELPELEVEPLPLDPGVSDFDLVLFLARGRSGELEGILQYSSDLFDATRMERLLGHYQVLLEGATASPSARVGEVPILTPVERAQLEREWNDVPAPPVAPAETFPALLASWAAATPDAVAASCSDAAVSYDALYRRVRRRASALAARGVGPESVVALLAERGLDFMEVVLAAFEVGAAYLPLDPMHPPERLHRVLATARPRLACVEEGLRPLLERALVRSGAAEAPAMVGCGELLGGASGAAPAPSRRGSHLAYVIYTSGSTGVPKGAMVTQAGMLNHLRAKLHQLGVGADSVVAQNASQCFDISVWQLLAPLAVGGRVRVVPDEVAHDPRELVAEVARARVTVLEVVPSMLRHLLEGLEGEASAGERVPLPALAWLIPTGEALPPELCRRWLALYPGVPLLNAYGPTECSDDVSHHPIRRPPSSSAHRTPIGRTLRRLRLHVVDPRGRTVPAGVPGELRVAGAGVGRGYLGEPRRTAEAFVPDPFASDLFSGSAGGRLYRTGDLAQVLHDGVLDFLGRLDHQVKVRGFRIELSEIEGALDAALEVRESAVTVRRNGGDDDRLVAFVVAAAGAGAGEDGARASDLEQVEAWRQIFDDAYGQRELSARDAGIHLRVWIDSTTGRPLSEDEIVECFEDSVSRILALRPRRVLEVGCGSGLLLHRIAPVVERYLGTDVSRSVLDDLRCELGAGWDGVELVLAAANELGELPVDFDLVVLNEVVQYFPSADYLVRVVEGAVERLAGGGWIFVGGVRHLGLLEAYHATVQLHRADPGLPLAELRRRVAEAMARDKELAVDPDFFSALRRRLPRLVDVRLQLKGGRSHNELTRFRYDVALRVAAAGEGSLAAPVERWLDWRRESLDSDRLGEVLASPEAPETVGVTGIPNARLAGTDELLRRLRPSAGSDGRNGDGATVSELRVELAGEIEVAGTAPDAARGGVEPASLWALAERLPYDVAVDFSPPPAAGRLQALFRRRDGAPEPFPASPVRAVDPGPWERFTNDPARSATPAAGDGDGAGDGALAGELRRRLGETLPPYMVPSVFVELEALPLLANGKVDRAALGRHPLGAEVGSVAPARSSAVPRSASEEVVAEVWRELLGLPELGIHDDVFDVGGHSLLATRAAARLRDAFGVELPLRRVFENPTVGLLASALEDLLRGGEGRAASPVEPAPEPPGGAYPLSLAQRRLWFLARLDPGSGAYHVPAALRLRGDLDRGALARSLTAIVCRHGALRTRFFEVAGEPVQRPSPPSPVPLPRVDLRRLPPARRERAVVAIARAEARRPFDFGRDLLLRGVLLELANDESVLVATLHHIASDAWSIGVVTAELAALYRAGGREASAELPELPVQYVDYALWQRRWLGDDALGTEVEYWRRRLAGAPPELHLPRDRPRPAHPTFRRRRLWRRWPASRRGALAALGRRHRATLFMTLLAAFQAFLARLSGARDLTVGTPIANRVRAEVEPLIGFFVNTLVLRADLRRNPDFTAFLDLVREACLGAYAHQNLPFERLVEELAPPRHLGRTPLFQVLFALQNAPEETLELPGLEIEPLDAALEEAKFDLTLVVAEGGGDSAGALGGGLQLLLSYNTDLFDGTTVERWLRSFEVLTAAALEVPERSLSALPVWSAAEAHQLTVEWPQPPPSSTAAAATGSVVERFAVMAAAYPEAVAVAWDGGGWSYRRLARRAWGVAGELRRRGIGPESVVAVELGRSPELVAALLGVLAAGAAFLPLDPEEPSERRRRILDDARPAALLGPAEMVSAGEAEAPALEAPPERAGVAYLLYTSGSTGRPKGVMVSRGSLEDYLAWVMAELLPGDVAADGVPLTSRPAFDAAWKQIFPPLLRGGAVRVVADADAADPVRLLAAIAGERVWNGVPALWEAMVAAVESGEAPPPQALRRVLLGGDLLPGELVARSRRLLPGLQVDNLYGPTEATANAAWASAVDAAGVTLGRAAGHARVTVMDAALRTLPLGAVGEVCLGGAALARGYRGDPRATAERFVPDPDGASGRLYRTGDRGAWSRSGELRFAGRVDYQLKLRGVRFEPAEIETALRAHPGVRDAAAVVAAGRLAAAVVAAGGTVPGTRELRAFLAARLPAAAVPSLFLPLSEFPRLAAGKLDRLTLSERVAAAVVAWAGEGSGEPRSPVEEQLLEVWREVLEAPVAGVHDDFFALGGHSLLATRVASRVRSVLGVELDLREFFERPTVAALAAAVEGQLAAAAGVAEAPPIEAFPASVHAAGVPLSFAQERLWFLHQLEPASAAYHVAAGVRLRGALDVPALRRSLAEIARRHGVLRTVFRTRGRRVVQVVEPPSPVPLPAVDLAALPGGRREAELRRLAAADVARPFDLVRGPLWRALLLRLGCRHHAVAVTLHHVVSDAWSAEVWARELAAFYRAFTGATVAGNSGVPEPALPEPEVQYADFAAWQRRHLRGEVLASLVEWWRRQLTGSPTPLELPLARPRPALLGYRGAAVAGRLGASVATAVRELSQGGRSTPFMVLLAAFGGWLGRVTGRRDLLVGVPVAQRRSAEVEGLIGFFVNTLAVRVELGGAPDFRELVERVRRRAVGAYTHQDLPFEKLVDELKVERDPSRAPLVQVVFQLHETAPVRLELPGLELEPIAADTRSAKFDLVVNLHSEAAGSDGWGASWIYNTDLFDRVTVGRLAAGFERLVAALAADPGRQVGEPSLLSPAERHQLLFEFAGGVPEEAPAAYLHDRFAACVAAVPEAVALSFEGWSVSYRELARRAALLAAELRRRGVGPESRVALCVERGDRLVAAIVGILQAGGAYLPLDPGDPRERLEWILADAGAGWLVTDSSRLEGLPAGGAERLPIDRLLDSTSGTGGPPSPAPASSATASCDQAAYVIYTSGSTGRPKGVVVSHRQVVRLFDAAAPWFRFDRGDVWTLFHSYAFDFSVWELWGALLSGARLVVVPDDTRRSPGDFHRLLERERVTVLNQTPTAFRQLARVDEEAASGAEVGRTPLSALQRVVFGGEALEPATLGPWFDRHGDCRPRLINMYGITETTVHVTWRPLSAADAHRRVGSPVGRPLADLELLSVDRRGEPVPLGVAGELHVGGAGLARGYLGRPALTAERFVPHPWSPLPGTRLYRSGDLGRRTPAGDVEHLGRIDRQVKVRGFRIELGEVEASVAAIPGVREVVVDLDPGAGNGEGRLVAWLAGSPPPVEELRRRLGEALPGHMVPAVFVVVDALPLTPQGKVDRRALPAPSRDRPELARPFRPPRDGLERSLAGLWAEILDLVRVGVDDDFFQLGGNSIRGAVLVNRLQAKLGEIVHVVALFDAPTPAAMAEFLRADYPRAVPRLEGVEGVAEGGAEGPEAPVGAAELAQLQALVEPLAPAPPSAVAGPQNPPAVFVLAPPRSGTTLLRVMLGGHPRLFAPPELELLSFTTLVERRNAFTGRDAFWLEGVLRAVMAVLGVDAETARAEVARREREGWSTKRFYRWLQEQLDDRLLVDKTPSYTLDPEILARIESDFRNARYVHLVRHPGGMVRSFEEARLDQIFFRRRHPFTTRRLAELIWLMSHRHVEHFLAGVPAERQLRVRFEELVRRPRQEMGRICDFLGLELHEAMLDPYADPSARLTDGLYAESKMLGDVKFHQYRRIDPAVAERWREEFDEATLGGPTRELARSFGYHFRSSALAVAEHTDVSVASSSAPLSHAQERLWFLHRFDPSSPLYNVPLALEAVGDFSPAAFGHALAGVVRRHAVLRTTFPERGGEAGQVASPPPASGRPWLVPEVDLRSLPPRRRRREARRLAGAEAVRPFDLACGPLFRATVLRLGAAAGEGARWGVLLNLHHVVADGWSMGLLFREVGFGYALAVGVASPLPPALSIQYADYAASERRRLAGPALAEQLAWWREQLAPASASLELPYDRPRPPVESFRGAVWRAPVDPAVARGAERLARSWGTTLFTVLLAAFEAFLFRLSGQRQVVVGTPVAGRDRPEFEPLIGLFVNTLVLRTLVAPELSGSGLLKRVRATVLAAFAHQEVPFEKLVAELETERRLDRPPLCQVVFTLQEGPSLAGGLPEPPELPGLELRPFGVSGVTGIGKVTNTGAKFELTLTMTRDGDGLGLALEYRTALLDATTAARWGQGIGRLLAAMVADPERPVATLELLSRAERHQLLTEWGWGASTVVSSSMAASVPALVVAQAATRPAAVALSASGALVSYGELVRRASAWARRLRRVVVSPEEPMAVAVAASPGRVVAQLAVLLAGAPYLPLDPGQPAARLMELAAGAGARRIFADPAVTAELASLAGSSKHEFLDVDDLSEKVTGTFANDTFADPDPARLAYLVYTSGSTGQPKAVVVGHGALANLVSWHLGTFGTDPGGRVTQLAGSGFDAAVWEVWPALAAGAALELAPAAVRTVPEALRGWLLERRVTESFLPTPLLESLLDLPWPSRASLATVLTGGDWLHRSPRPGLPFRLVNNYGPTENAVVATSGPVSPSLSSGGPLPPLGRPLPGVAAQVVDRHLLPVPAGVVGELVLGGRSLARGYLRRPAHTAELFVPDPEGRGARLYRTGDRVRFRAAGELEFLGRLDRQIQLRGVRVEPGEIEARIGEHPAVAEAAVALRSAGGDSGGGDDGPAVLVAFVVAATERDADDVGTAGLPAELQTHLGRHLPEALVPSRIEVLGALPLTVNGKVDRDELARRPLPAAPSRTAATPVEELLIEVWADLLDLPAARVGPDSHFFELGGHSLLATRAVSRVRDLFAVELPLRVLFEAPTPARLGLEVEALRRSPEAPLAPPVVPVPRGGDLPVSFAQRRLWFLDRLVPDNPFYNIYSAFRLVGSLDRAALAAAFTALARRHETLRTTFRAVAGEPRQRIAAPAPVLVPVVDLAGLPAVRRGAVLEELSRAAARRPFDLERGPLLRVTVVRLEAAEHALLFNIHHIVSDGWSTGVLTAEVAELYRSAVRRCPPSLPSLPVQYADLAAWQRRWLTGSVRERLLSYWRRALEGAPEMLELPLDRPRPAVESFRGGMVPLRLDARRSGALRVLSRRLGATVSMTLLAGWKALLHRLTGQPSIPVGTAVANRNRSEIEGLIGFFVNTLVLHTRFGGRLGFAGAVARVREVALGAYEHQDLPFDLLVEELQLARDLSRNPLCQVMFGYHNFPQRPIELEELSLLPVGERRVDTGTAKFDLTLFVVEVGDELHGSFEHNSDLFDRVTMLRWVDHLTRLLDGALEDPKRPLAEIPLLSPSARAQVTREWNDTLGDYPREESLARLFARQAARRPEAVALDFDVRDFDGSGFGVQLTFGEVARRSNRLAHHLQALGLRSEEPVGVAVERSAELVMALLAVVAAGGCYLPLDADYPAERLAFMLADGGAQLLITAGTDPTAVLPEVVAGAVRRVDLLADGAAIARRPSTAPPATPASRGDQLAYLIYTSGSTGRPKGVAIPQRAVARLVLGADYLQLSPGERVAQASNASFDAATFELWGALLNGARLMGMPKEVALEPAELERHLRSRRVGALFLTTALFNQLVNRRPGVFAPLRHLLFGGEAVDTAAVRQAFGSPPERLLHVYGPTESTTFASWHRVRAEEPEAVEVPIGSPIRNTTIHVVIGGEVAPPRVVGELQIGGDGLARGYHRQPARTAEAFVPDLFAGAPGARLYRTGDRVRRRTDGAVVFVGRRDLQVKLRGFRIELGEIEAVLGRYPSVRESVVTVHRESGGDRRLVAYLVRDPDAALDDALPGSEGRGVWSDQVSEWEMIFDDIYRRDPDVEVMEGFDPTFDVVGWDSTYTGEPLPAAEMREWLDETVERIRGLAPRRVLEIGCGTGMILFRIAPGSERYLGVDVSKPVLEELGRRLAVRGSWPQVELAAASADRLEGLAPGSFDTVILNSVVQYFPGVDYLLRVLRRAVELVAPGGTIFLGDLRSLPLQETFQADVVLHQAAPETAVSELRRHLGARLQQENELVVDPALFHHLVEEWPEVAAVGVHPKRGRAQNELTAFRYQVVLRVVGGVADPAGADQEPPEFAWRDWSREGMGLGELRRLLAGETAPALAFHGVPNARVARAAAVRELIVGGGSEVADAAAVHRRVAAVLATGVEPEALRELADGTPYRVELGWSRPGAAGAFEAVFVRRDAPSTAPPPPPGVVSAAGPAGFANDPLRGKLARRLVPEVRSFVAERLPDYMVPAAFVLLDALPLTANGKVDRKALPAPVVERATAAGFVAPRTVVEERLAAIFREVLGLEEVGVEDDFFALGGHSLLATQVVSRVRHTLSVEVPLKALFEHPMVAGLASALEDLRRGAETLPLESVARDGDFPLSFAQERLWFLERLEPATGAYNVADAVELAGEVSEAAVSAAVSALRRRHETLRTRFVAVAGEPRQVIDSPALAPLPVVDLTALCDLRREVETASLLRLGARRRFDLERGPLFRAVLLRLGVRRRLLALEMHHIVSDGWSMGVLFRELAAFYEAAREGRSASLSPLPVQYADFAVWQRRWLRGAELKRQLGYWEEALAGAPPVLEIPPDRPRPAEQTFRGRALPVRLDAATSAALRRLCQRSGVTPFMALLAVFDLLLMRHADTRDPVVGAPISNRNRYEIEGLIGFFVNTLVLRVPVPDDPTGQEILERVSEVTLGAYDHQDLPFETLVGVLRPPRDLARHPLFQIFFQLQNAPPTTVSLRGVELGKERVATRSSKFDLSWMLQERGGRVIGEIEYNTDLYDATTVRRLWHHYRQLLAGLVAVPERRVSSYSLLAAAELHQVMVEWSGRVAGGEGLSLDVAAQVAEQAARTPSALALRAGGEVWSYGELAARVRRLAAALRRRGVGPEVPVGICLERSPAMMVAILGVLKAGGAYVPLDPAYPAERLAFILDDVAAPWVLTSRQLTAVPGTVRRLELDPRTGLPESMSGAVPAAESMDGSEEGRSSVALERLALVIYTSGSTGKPKGVGIRHRGVAALLAWARERYGADELAGVYAATSINFDLSVFELFAPLTTGGTVILGRDALAIADDPERQRVTLLNTVPSALAELLHRGAVPSSVRVVNLAGEPLPGELVVRAAALPGVRRVDNLYGPSEDTTYSTAARVERSGEPWPPIGRPLAGKAAYLLERRWRPVAAGMVGELYLGGPGLARGYLRRPGATAARFVPDPFGRRPGGRLYRTGDLARRLADGELRFLGRFDDQVKVRGFRVELGEIESWLGRYPAVAEGRVVARGELGERRLVAYLVSAPGVDRGELTADRLRPFLLRELPAYMVPSDFIVLDTLPRLPNSKLDRSALPAPEAVRPELRNVYEAPVGETEAAFAGVLRELLEVDQVGRHDSFFDLGAHSLVLVRVQARLEEALGRPVPLLELFRYPSVAALSARLASVDGDAGEPAAPADRGEQLSAARRRLARRRRLRDD